MSVAISSDDASNLDKDQFDDDLTVDSGHESMEYTLATKPVCIYTSFP